MEHAHTLSNPLHSIVSSLKVQIPRLGFHLCPSRILCLSPSPSREATKKLILHEKALSPLHHFSVRISNRGMGQLVQISRNREQVCARATFGGNQHHPQGRLRKTDGRPDGRTEGEGDRRARFQPPFRGGGGNNGPTVRIPSTPTHFLTSVSRKGGTRK